jgi:hypothetical protein
MEVIKTVKERLIAHCLTWDDVVEAVRRFEPSGKWEVSARSISITYVGPMDGVEGFWVVETNELSLNDQVIEHDAAFA